MALKKILWDFGVVCLNAPGFIRIHILDENAVGYFLRIIRVSGQNIALTGIIGTT